MKAVYQQVCPGLLEMRESRLFIVIVRSQAVHRLPAAGSTNIREDFDHLVDGDPKLDAFARDLVAGYSNAALQRRRKARSVDAHGIDSRSQVWHLKCSREATLDRACKSRSIRNGDLGSRDESARRIEYRSADGAVSGLSKRRSSHAEHKRGKKRRLK